MFGFSETSKQKGQEMKTQNSLGLWKPSNEGLPGKKSTHDSALVGIKTLQCDYACDEVKQEERILIHRSEIESIRCNTLEWGDTETGGHLYGAYTGSGTPIVMLATPPGPQAVHSTATFIQDINYFRRCSEKIYKRFGLCFIGRWHSHHVMGLRRPSMGDIASASSIMAKNCIPTFVELITTMSPSKGNVTINAYIYR